MLWIISAVLLGLWLASMAFSLAGAMAHLFLVAALVVILLRAWQGRSPIR